ncbi:MAG TPA: hemerythrin domain-containing protein [Nitrosospira sp.]
MSRIGVLLSLSREHHHSLVMARDARRAADNGDAAIVAAAVARMESHWHALMAAHFDEEERLIRMAEDTLDAESVARILSEHCELRRLAGGPCELEPATRLLKFADLASAHVRYEERVFFPQLQAHSCVGAAARAAG